MAHSSKKAVLTAIISNTIVTVIKFIAAILTQSTSMMNEAIHSLMDTTNQGFLYRGLVAGQRPADKTHAFGHGQKKYLWNLWSAIGLFSIGAGLGLAHAYHAWANLAQHQEILTVSLLGYTLPAIWLSIGVLTTATILEGYSFIIALRVFTKQMRAEGESNIFTFLGKSDDPTLVAVVLEDSVAILGLMLATLGIGLSAWYGDPRWDIAFSVAIAILLGLVAIFLGIVNTRYLTDIRDLEAETAFQQVIAEHHEVERYHDLRSIIIDDQHTILVAEIELREEAMLSGLNKKIDVYEEMIRDMVPEERLADPKMERYIQNRATVQAVLERTELIIEELVTSIKDRAPQVSHATIEVEGIATAPENRLPSYDL